MRFEKDTKIKMIVYSPGYLLQHDQTLTFQHYCFLKTFYFAGKPDLVCQHSFKLHDSLKTHF